MSLYLMMTGEVAVEEEGQDKRNQEDHSGDDDSDHGYSFRSLCFFR